MAKKIVLLIAFGTRPEWLKIRPVVDAIEGKIPYRLLFTGQHADLIDPTIKNYKYREINISNDISPNRLDSIVCSIMSQIDEHLDGITHVMVQGDTTTVFAVGLACFHRNVRVIHLEAGLRTYDNQHPYPEEFNRQAVGCIADIHLCATELAANNLRKENKGGEIHIVGNTVLDNLRGHQADGDKNILVTMHRRENHERIEEWFDALNSLASKHKNFSWIIPIHPNPNILKHHRKIKNLEICNPLDHSSLLNILKRCRIVITDSGGIQEEAAFFKKPCIVCREKTERSEGLGDFSFLCQAPEMLDGLFKNLLNHKIDESLECPYGDGYASQKTLKILEKVIK
jgi:UDP-N-acetylglucosamine 2-epimerase (non-hydrolysing)